jgi:hypothetical protein
LAFVCDPENPTLNGFLFGYNGDGVTCSSSSMFSFKTPDTIVLDNTITSDKTLSYLHGLISGTEYRPSDYQIAYLMRLYNEIKENSGNEYMMDWQPGNVGDIVNYTGVDSYYLYSKDFKALGCQKSKVQSGGHEVFVVNDSTGAVGVERYNFNKSSGSAYSFVGSEMKSCVDILNQMNEKLEEYVKHVDFEVYKVCSTAIKTEMDKKRDEINEKYGSGTDASDEQKKLAQEILDEYDDIETTGKYVSKREGVLGSTVIAKDEIIPVLTNYGSTEGEMPADYIWTCRNKLPFIEVTNKLDPDWENALNESDDQQCYETSGAVAWLVCPIIKMASGIGNSLWSTIEKSFMIIPSEIFNENAGVRTAWDVIRNIGNIFFVVLFMIVIFSQLTGVGIDNYGIKKILPKLILVAVLANLSWIICELVVDVSNIVGSSITGLLTNVASTIATPSGLSTTKMVVGGVGDFALATGGAALFVLLNGWNLAGLAALGLAVLGVVISIVSGIIVMYIILIVRQAGVILLIALSPIAIVCYALPNTEKLFKKWRDLFKALLVVYPLCGAAIGAGKLASAVLASIAGGDSSGLLTAASAAISAGDIGKLTTAVFAAENNGSTGLMLAAMIVQVLPFFFIPKLLKNSLALMGNIGEKISRTGRSLGRKTSNLVQGGVKNSDRFKSFQKFETEKMKTRRAVRARNRNDSRIEDGLSGADRAEFRALRNKVRSGESLSDSEMKKYNELKDKSTYKPSDWQNRLTGEANTTIMGFQQSLDKDKQNTDDLYVAGQMKSSEHAIQEATDKAYDWNEQLLVDEFNNTWVSNGKGKYVTVDKNGKRHTAAAATLESMPGVRKVSRSEAMQNKEYVDRRRQIGQLAGWTNKDTATEAAVGAQLSSTESSRSDVQQTRLSGDKNVLQLQHDENTSKMNELEGRAQANAEFRKKGDTVVGVEAARQAAEARLAGVIAQNAAAKEYATRADATDITDPDKKIRYKVKEKNKDTGEIEEKYLTRDEINQRAIETAINKQISQKTGEVAVNVTGAIQTDYEVALKNAQSKHNLDVAGNDPNLVSEITPEYAKSQVKARFDSSQQKMFSDDMANSSRPDILKDMAAGLLPDATADPNRLIAGARTLVAKGGLEDFNKFMFDYSDKISGKGKEVSKILTDYMATLSEPVSKAYGKHVAKLREDGVAEADIPTFAKWMTKTDDLAGDKGGERSFQGFMRVNGNTALANASEDTVKFYNSLFESSPEAKAAIKTAITPQMVVNGSLTAKDNKTLLAFNKMITNVIDGSPDKVERDKRRVAAIKGMTTSGWAHMKESTFSALMAPYMTVPDKNGVQHIDKAKLAAALAASKDLRDAVEDAGKNLKKAGGTVLSTMQPELREFFKPYMT